MTSIPDLSPAEYRKVKITELLDSIVTMKSELIETIFQAKNADDHAALGYSSWTSYVADAFGGQLGDLKREDLRLAEVALADAGMSSRAIAQVTNLSDRQVRRDIARGQVGHGVPPEDGDVHDDDGIVLEPYVRAAVVGLDGKKYARVPLPTPSTPRRRNLPDAYYDAMRDLAKVSARLERLTQDDRFLANRERIRSGHYGDLSRFQSQLWRVRKAMNGEVVVPEAVCGDD